MMKYDYVIVGCGLAGIVLANKIANEMDKKVLILDKRDHIGGNCYDLHDEHGVLIHKYGPHIFHTNFQEVYNYLSNFTDWHVYQFQARTMIDGRLTNLPFNLNTMEAILEHQLFRRLSEKLISTYGYDTTIPILELKKSDDTELKWLADFIYEKVYVHYIAKQWDLKPEDLDPSVMARVPVYISRDDRYFKDRYQVMPKQGYTAMFKKMLDHKNIHVMLNANANDFIEVDETNQAINFQGKRFEGKVIFTGQIDALFGHKFGELPYRSLRFDFVNYQKEQFQEVAMVSYPNNYDFTRITETKHMTGQDCKTTTVVYEYPQAYDKDDITKDVPYYPIPKDDNHALYEQYKKYAEKFDNLLLVGRLAEYKYFNMDQMIMSALEKFKVLSEGDK